MCFPAAMWILDLTAQPGLMVPHSWPRCPGNVACCIKPSRRMTRRRGVGLALASTQMLATESWKSSLKNARLMFSPFGIRLRCRQTVCQQRSIQTSLYPTSLAVSEAMQLEWLLGYVCVEHRVAIHLPQMAVSCDLSMGLVA